MARPRKTGLDYFPFDCDFFSDEKVVSIAGEFGLKGEISIIKLLCAVYRNGYYIEWSEMLKYKMLRELPGVSADMLEQIVNRLVKWGFFDKDLFDSVRVLSSKGIQRRYFDAVRLRKLSGNLPFILSGIKVSSLETTVSNEEIPQSKVNKSKVISLSTENKCDEAVAEKERILEVFYFEKNCVDYLGEARRFFSHYEADGWRRKGNSVPVANKVALARCWKVDTPVGRNDTIALGWYRSVYEKVKACRPEVARVMIRNVSTVSFVKKSEYVDVVISVKDKETASFIDDAFVHALKGDDLVKGIALKYQICVCKKIKHNGKQDNQGL